MFWQQLYYWSKKIHRLAMWAAILFGVPLALSGVALHKLVEGQSYFFVTNENTVRFIHNRVSNPFALTLAVMMVTGFVLWLVPKILAARTKR